MALQIRGDQLTGIKNASIHNDAAINLSKLSLSDSGEEFSGDLTFSGDNTHSGSNSLSGSISLTAAGSLDVSSGALTLADNQISGDKVEGGTIASITINSLSSGTVDIDGGAIDGTAIGSSSHSTGKFTTLESTGVATLASAVVTGNLTVNGTTTTVNSTTVTVDDPIFTLGGDGDAASDDNLDRGIEFKWHNGSAAKLGFFGYDDSEEVFTFIQDATNTSEVFSGSVGNVKFGAIEGSSFSDGTITGVTFLDDDSMASASDTTLPTSESVKAYVDSKTSSGNLNLSAKVDNTSIELDDNNKLSIKDLGVTNAMLAGSIANAKLSNSSVTIGNTEIDLGSTSTTLAGLTSVSSTSFAGNLAGSVAASDGTVLVNATSKSLYLTGNDTDDLTEGSSNLYYTNDRADARIAAASIGDVSDVSLSSTKEGGDMLLWDGSDYVNVKMVIDNHTIGASPGNSITLGASSDSNFYHMAQVYLNGQKMRFSSDSTLDSDEDYYFSADGEITFSNSLIVEGDNVEVILYVAQS